MTNYYCRTAQVVLAGAAEAVWEYLQRGAFVVPKIIDPNALVAVIISEACLRMGPAFVVADIRSKQVSLHGNVDSLIYCRLIFNGTG